MQTFRDFELVIADDGSTQETALLIGRLRKKTGLPIRHMWHEDRAILRETRRTGSVGTPYGIQQGLGSSQPLRRAA